MHCVGLVSGEMMSSWRVFLASIFMSSYSCNLDAVSSSRVTYFKYYGAVINGYMCLGRGIQVTSVHQEANLLPRGNSSINNDGASVALIKCTMCTISVLCTRYY